MSTSIGSMSSLGGVGLGQKYLHTSFSNIFNLEVVDLAKNSLSGLIPKEISKLHKYNMTNLWYYAIKNVSNNIFL